MKLISLVDTDTQIGWWNANRQKFNAVAKDYNQWCMYTRHDPWKAHTEARALLLRLDLLREKLEDSPFAHGPIEQMKTTLNGWLEEPT